MRWLYFLLSHSLFVACCAVALCYQSFLVLGSPADPFLYALVFFSTLASYNFYWLISQWYFNKGFSLGILLKENFSNCCIFFISSICLLYCLYQKTGFIAWITAPVLFTILYSLPLWPLKQPSFIKKAGFLKTLLLALTWSFVTVMLPARLVVWEMPYAVLLLFVLRFLFMLVLCIIFDKRDAETDKMHAFSSLATDISPRSIHLIITVVFGLYVVVLLAMYQHFINGRMLMALFMPALLALVVYRLSLGKRGYLFYYFLVDGLMLISALSSFLATI